MAARNAEVLGKLGVWTWLDMFRTPEAVELAAEIESLGYSALWTPEAVGRDPFALISRLSAATKKLVFATGIANIYARDPMSLNAIQHTVGEITGGRFVLGLGVSHARLVTGVRGHEYRKPVTTMREYLDAMAKALYMGPRFEAETPIVLAALRPNMLKLAAEKTAGAHPYNVTPEHTRRAREILGPGPTLAPEQMVLRETNPVKAREIARKNLATYLPLPNYYENWRWLGFEDADWQGGGSDRLIDAIVCWGDEDKIRAHVQAHYDAGADHVCIQPFRPDGQPGPDIELLRALAPGGPAAARRPRPAAVRSARKKPAAKKSMGAKRKAAARKPAKRKAAAKRAKKK
ncbi:MAG TPA: TIGR03620 family F420-dependent LLM class oxidoreductase [Myxococcota bacterium]|nr:TIGR03620 family F420-dependent LLM class oxidoreductase [Myxococcota bacterium]